MADRTGTGLRARFAGAAAWARELRPVRVFLRYLTRRGPLLSAGLSYEALFAVFAALWVGFAIAGFYIAGNPALSEALFALLDTSLPGLIDDGSGTGAIDPSTLLEADVLGWTGVVALVGLFVSALAWLASARKSVRDIFDAPDPTTNFFLLKLKDFGLAIAFGAAVIVSAALSVASTAALDWVLDILNLAGSRVDPALTRGTGLVLMFALDTAALATLYRVLSGLRIPVRRLLAGSMLAAAALGGLKLFGTLLLGGATRNPLLASFAVIIGLLIWFNLVCQVILIGASWIAVGMADRGLAPDPAMAAAERERVRVERERIQAEARELVPRWLRWSVRAPGPAPGAGSAPGSGSDAASASDAAAPDAAAPAPHGSDGGRP